MFRWVHVCFHSLSKYYWKPCVISSSTGNSKCEKKLEEEVQADSKQIKVLIEAMAEVSRSRI
jgi:hypothetical protein